MKCDPWALYLFGGGGVRGRGDKEEKKRRERRFECRTVCGVGGTYLHHHFLPAFFQGGLVHLRDGGGGERHKFKSGEEGGEGFLFGSVGGWMNEWMGLGGVGGWVGGRRDCLP